MKEPRKEGRKEDEGLKEGKNERRNILVSGHAAAVDGAVPVLIARGNARPCRQKGADDLHVVCLATEVQGGLAVYRAFVEECRDAGRQLPQDRRHLPFRIR